MEESVVQLETELRGGALTEFVRRCDTAGLQVEPIIFEWQAAAPSLTPPTNRLLVRKADLARVQPLLASAESEATRSEAPSRYARRLRFLVRAYVVALAVVILLFLVLFAFSRFLA